MTMRQLSVDDFGSFFEALWDGDPPARPFAWQNRLARRVAEAGWPETLALPTSSGKTACIDIAVFTLALEAGWPQGKRRAPRRIFFVVDRRIVVDQAFRRASAIAEKLKQALGPGSAVSPVLREVAERLSQLGGGGEPLLVERLRGGLPRENAWLHAPAQPAVICATVDQIGSRLLFRSYDGSRHMAPVHAGLVANDALVLLDEAHCAKPFLDTLRAVARYRSEAWAERPVRTPFQAVVLSATPPASESTFELQAEDAHDERLWPRLRASKPAALVLVGGRRAESRESLASELPRHVVGFLRRRGCRRIAVMVNRVGTAVEVWRALRRELAPEGAEPEADVVLITGRFRPLERERLAARWEPVLRAGAGEPPRPVVVVSTQCLEVGADFDFDALVTECASLDALRQRFGRLNRLGRPEAASAAVIVATAEQAQKAYEDVIYGKALSATWRWLVEHAERVRQRGGLSAWPWLDRSEVDGVIDFGVEALRSKLPGGDALNALEAPHEPAPVLLPAYLDRWVQTDPAPVPDPDPALFLHGPGLGTAEVVVVWRADLVGDEAAASVGRDRAWLDAVALCPPRSAEALTVPLGVVRAWMAGRPARAEDLGDVEGQPVEAERAEGTKHAVVVWRGRDESFVARSPSGVRPGAVVVVPASAESLEALTGVPAENLARDLAEEAYWVSGKAPVLRLARPVIRAWPRFRTAELLERFVSEKAGADWDEDADSALDDVLRHVAADESAPGWLREIADALTGSGSREVVAAPAGGWVVRGRAAGLLADDLLDADADDGWSAASGPVPLSEHLAGVAARAEQAARLCGLEPELIEDVARAAAVHDLGKADPRFQAFLHRGDPVAAAVAPEPLAKSGSWPMTRAVRREAARRAGLPRGFRHELLSVRLAEALPGFLASAYDPDLVLHLIGTHHGRCRPFAPPVRDEEPEEVRVHLPGSKLVPETEVAASSATGLERLGSGVADRFWRLVRRYGWWGLAYLEAILRTADHAQSAAEAKRAASRLAAPVAAIGGRDGRA